MIRTALAAQASGMMVTVGSADIYNPKVVRAAAGSLFSLPIVTGVDVLEAISICRKHKLTVYGCEPAGNKASCTAYWEVDYTKPVALVLGNEGQGLDAQTLNAVDGTISVPMNPASESLNVSVCAGILLFAARQQRTPGSYNKNSHGKSLHD
jgi:RNA methyltransferase, TrmH family